jgi:hypothetical protein
VREFRLFTKEEDEMVDEVSRRNVIVLAGAGVLASACSGKPSGNDHRSPAENRGHGDIYGSPPGKEKPVYLSPNPTNCPMAGYAPAFIAILFIDFPGGAKISVNHASFSTTDPSPEGNGRLEQALKLIELRTNSARFSDLNEPTIYPRTMGNKGTDRVSFDDFDFKSQSELFIFFNSSDIELGKDRNWLISFTPYSSTGERRAPNYSYANAQVVTAIGNLKGKLIRVENHVTDPFGCLLESTCAHYSMNIHFMMPLRDGGLVPMVIDPDTGNGVGYEP